MGKRNDGHETGKGMPIYPDANSTLRLTYGQVLSYEPADGVVYDAHTTLKGVMEKEDPGNWEFVVPQVGRNYIKPETMDAMVKTVKCLSALLLILIIQEETPAVRYSIAKDN